MWPLTCDLAVSVACTVVSVLVLVMVLAVPGLRVYPAIPISVGVLLAVCVAATAKSVAGRAPASLRSRTAGPGP